MTTDDMDKLRRGNLKNETKPLLLATQNNVLYNKDLGQTTKDS